MRGKHAPSGTFIPVSAPVRRLPGVNVSWRYARERSSVPCSCKYGVSLLVTRGG